MSLPKYNIMGQMKKQLFLSISCKQSEGNDIMKEIFRDGSCGKERFECVVAMSSGYFRFEGNFLAHRSPVGAMSFATGPEVPLTKVFQQGGEAPTYLFRFWAQKRNIAKQGAIHAQLLADGRQVPLEPVGAEADMHAADVFCGSYRVAEEALQQAAHAASYEFQLVGADGSVLWRQRGKN